MPGRVVYITCETPEQAARIGRSLVEERLVACTNMIPGMQSCYWWDGAVRESAEVVLLAKTTADRVADVTDRVRALHSYDTPCVVALPIDGGNPDYLRWIEAEVAAG